MLDSPHIELKLDIKYDRGTKGIIYDKGKT